MDYTKLSPVHSSEERVIHLEKKFDKLIRALTICSMKNKEIYINGVIRLKKRLPEFTEENMLYLNKIWEKIKESSKYKKSYEMGLLKDFVGIKFNVDGPPRADIEYSIASLSNNTYTITWIEKNGIIARVLYEKEHVHKYFKDGSWIIIN
jgi:phenolic acid decarboxylase